MKGLGVAKEVPRSIYSGSDPKLQTRGALEDTVLPFHSDLHLGSGISGSATGDIGVCHRCGRRQADQENGR